MKTDPLQSSHCWRCCDARAWPPSDFPSSPKWTGCCTRHRTGRGARPCEEHPSPQTDLHEPRFLEKRKSPWTQNQIFITDQICMCVSFQQPTRLTLVVYPPSRRPSSEWAPPYCLVDQGHSFPALGSIPTTCCSSWRSWTAPPTRVLSPPLYSGSSLSRGLDKQG